VNPAYHPYCYQCRKEAGKPPAGVSESHLCLSHLHAERERLLADRAAAADLVRELEESLGDLLDGLDSNRTGECEGLSEKQWEARIRKAREVLARADAQGKKSWATVAQLQQEAYIAGRLASFARGNQKCLSVYRAQIETEAARLYPEVPPAPSREKLPPLGDVVGAMSEMNDLIQKGGKL